MNKKNAKYLLSGYNTLSVEEQERFDIESYLIFFRKFVILLTIISSFLFFILNTILTLKSSLIGYSIFLIIMIFWFLFKPTNYKKNQF